MVTVLIPSLPEITSGIGYVTNGACDMASTAVQQWINSPSTAQMGLNVLAAQIEALEQLVVKLRGVAQGVEQVYVKLVAAQELEWHSPAGRAFRVALGSRQLNAKELEATALDTVRLARLSIDELRTVVASLQTLLATVRATAGAAASSAIEQVC